jgi:hypothetical protein
MAPDVIGQAGSAQLGNEAAHRLPRQRARAVVAACTGAEKCGRQAYLRASNKVHYRLVITQQSVSQMVTMQRR